MMKLSFDRLANGLASTFRNTINKLMGEIEENFTETVGDLNKAKADASAAVAKADEAKVQAESVQAQFNQVVIEGDSSVEAAQARVDAKNVAQPTLKARLDNDYNEVTAQLAEKTQEIGNLLNLGTTPRSLVETIVERGINVKDYGVVGDGVTDDTIAIQSILDTVPSYSTLFFPFGDYKIATLTVPPNKIGLTILGLSKESTTMIFSSLKALSLMSGYITFKNIEIQGNNQNGSILFSDDRTEGTADFDIALYDCLFTHAQNLVKVVGRGVVIERCIFKSWLQDGYIIDADFPEPFVPGTAWTGTLVTGFRSFVIRNNRFHFVTSAIFRNKGYNARNISGIQITGNFIEGALKYYDGYARDLTVGNNDHYQVPTNTTHLALFTLDGGDNININLSFSLSNRETDVGYDYIFHSASAINNLSLRGVVFGIKSKAVVLVGGGNVIDIDLNIRRMQAGTMTHFVHLLSSASGQTFRNVSVKGRMESPNATFIGLEADTNLQVIKYSTEILMSGTYGSYSKGLNPLECVSQPGKTSTYLGNGSTQTIDLKFKPRTVQVIGIEGSGEIPTYNNLTVTGFSSASLITVNEGGFTVTGAANVSGKKYIYITT